MVFPARGVNTEPIGLERFENAQKSPVTSKTITPRIAKVAIRSLNGKAPILTEGIRLQLGGMMAIWEGISALPVLPASKINWSE